MKSKRNVYLKMKTLEEAQEILHGSFAVSHVLAVETIPVPEAVGRILARIEEEGFRIVALRMVRLTKEEAEERWDGLPGGLIPIRFTKRDLRKTA